MLIRYKGKDPISTKGFRLVTRDGSQYVLRDSEDLGLTIAKVGDKKIKNISITTDPKGRINLK